MTAQAQGMNEAILTAIYSRRPFSICTHLVHPPIPDRSRDWCAFYEGQEESGHYGWGATEPDAIRDLMENYDA